MALIKITFDGSSVSARQDADINYHLCGLKAEGVIKGLGGELAVSVSNNYISFKSGYVQIYGRRIYVEEGSNVYVSLDSTKYGYIIIEVNLNNNTVSLTKLEGASYPSLKKENLSTTGLVYQMAIARYSKTATSLTLDTTFKPEVIPTALSVAESALSSAQLWVQRNYNRYYLGGTKSYKVSYTLTSDEYNTLSDTLFMIYLTNGVVIPFPGALMYGSSSASVSFSIGSNSYTVSGSRGLSSYSVGFTLSNTSLQIKFCHCYR